MLGLGPLELTLILVIVIMLFGVGKLPEIFGAVGKGIQEFRKGAETASPSSTTDKATSESVCPDCA